VIFFQEEKNEDETIFEMASSTESNSQPKAKKPDTKEPEVVVKSPSEPDQPLRKSLSEIESPASEAQLYTFQQLQQQQLQSKSRKLSLKEKRKLRAERELTPRDVEQAAMPPAATTPPQPPPDITQAFQKQLLPQPPVSGGSQSPSARNRFYESVSAVKCKFTSLGL
jgi:hypothetical protein